MNLSQSVINQTKKWINDVVIGFNFCPFAYGVVKQHKVHYEVDTSKSLAHSLDAFIREINRLDVELNIETSFLIFPESFKEFSEYLDLVELAEQYLKENNYEGIYQVASFHPLYKFANSNDTDPANYTNRSVYPMLHILREDSIERALETYKNPQEIPERNIRFAKEKGLIYMKMLRDACLNA